MNNEFYNCKISGCEGKSHLTRGAYAFLCSEHRKIKAASVGGGRKKGPNGRSSIPRVTARLIECAERIDTAIGNRRAAHNQLVRDINLFNDQLKVLQAELSTILKDAN